MKKVTTNGPLLLVGGRIAVTAAQLARRQHLLRPVEDDADDLDEGFDVVEIVKPVQFKAGEVLYLSAELMGKKGLPSVTIDGEDTEAEESGAAGDKDPDDPDPADNDKKEGGDAGDKKEGSDASDKNKDSAPRKKASKKKASKKKAKKKTSGKQ